MAHFLEKSAKNVTIGSVRGTIFLTRGPYFDTRRLYFDSFLKLRARPAEPVVHFGSLSGRMSEKCHKWDSTWTPNGDISRTFFQKVNQSASLAPQAWPGALKSYQNKAYRCQNTVPGSLKWRPRVSKCSNRGSKIRSQNHTQENNISSPKI